MDLQIYNNNIKAIRERYPKLAELIEEKKAETDMQLQISLEESWDGEPVLRVQKESQKCYLCGKRKPKETSVRKIEQWGTLNRAASIYVVGLGNIALIRALLEKTDAGINIMVYEPSAQIFYYIIEHVDVADLFADRALGLVIEGINGDERDGVIQAFLNLGNVGYLKVCTNSGYEMLFPEQIINYLKRIDKISTDLVVGYNTQIRFSRVKADNVLHNVKYVCDGYITTQLCDVLPTDIPAIVVSAGPSLNKNIHELRRAKNRAFIIAVDTAVKPLIKAGVIPDLYVIVDGVKPVELVDVEEAKQIPLMPSIVSSKHVLDHHKGKKIFYNEGYGLVSELLHMNGIRYSNIASGGSVACSAFSLAYKLGFSTIILVGQDLALTGNKTHADGTFQDKMEEIDTSHCKMVEGNYEEWVPTRADFKLYLEWFNYYIEGCEDVHVINATEGGAKIQNTEIMTLADAIDRECQKEVDISECMNRMPPILDGEKRQKAVKYLNSLPNMMRNLQKDVKKERDNYKKLRKICQKDKIDTSAYLHILNRIKQFTKKIETHPLFSIVQETMSVAEYIITSEQYNEEASLKEEGLEIARKGIRYMELADQCISLLLPMMEETVGKIK